MPLMKQLVQREDSLPGIEQIKTKMCLGLNDLNEMKLWGEYT